MTLIELLIAVTILGILAGLVLGVGAVAAESARAAQTRSTILRIHTLLVDQLDTYRNRRVSLTGDAEQAITVAVNSAPATVRGRLRGQLTAEARLHALREVMLTELPDRWSDVLLGAVPGDPTAATPAAPMYAAAPRTTGRTSLGGVMYREYQRAAAVAKNQSPADNGRARLLQNQSAECLFAIVMLTTGDGEAPGLFGEKVIGDTDGDGAREFLDGWGNPIRFLRWAPGVDSPTQLNVDRLKQIGLDATRRNPPEDADEAIAAAVNQNRDPFDLFRIQRYTTTQAALLTDTPTENDADGAFGYSLLPLVYSTGGNEESGLVDSGSLPGLVVWAPSGPVPPPTSTPTQPPASPRYRFQASPDPFLKLDGGAAVNRQIGSKLAGADGAAADDNVTNHRITARATK